MLPIKRIRHQMTICRVFLGIVLILTSIHVMAEDAAKTYKKTSQGNPISSCVFCADPTALEYDGRLYVYGSNDHQQFISKNKTGNNDYGAIKSIVVFSTDDMVNWTFHGTIHVGKLCSGWGWQFANSWAPSVTWREGTNGKKEFFMYFANGAGNVGVLTAESPLGPWKSPLSGPMITDSYPGVSPCKWCFDPGVVIDEDGTGWIGFGGGGLNKNDSHSTYLQPNNACIAKLKSNMIELDGNAVKIPAPYHFEASELNIINNRFVYTYCTHFDIDNSWSSYEKRGDYPRPGNGVMCYMTTDDPLNSDSWEYRGEYIPNPGSFGYGGGNNHTHMQKFAGNYYVFYHSSMLLQSMQSNNEYKDAGGYRSLCVNTVTVDESTQTIDKLTMTRKGVSAIKNLDPYKEQQAETMASSGGVNYEDFKNITKTRKINTLGNDASENLYIKMAAGAWTMVRDVDFGDEGAKAFILKAKGTGKLEIRLNKVSKEPVVTLNFSSEDFTEHHIAVDPSLFKDVQKVFFVFTESTDVQFDAWQFSTNEADGISYVKAIPQKKSSGLYDISGRRLQKKPHQGIYLKDGKKYIAK